MKKLRDYPYIKEAFIAIYLDQPYPATMATVKVLADAQLPDGWERFFDTTEKVLRQMSHYKLGVLIPNFAKVKSGTFEGCNANDSALEYVVMTVNDSDELLMAAAKVPYLERDVVKHVLHAFFDGPLREVFQKTEFVKRKEPKNPRLDLRHVFQATASNKNTCHICRKDKKHVDHVSEEVYRVAHK